MRIANRALVPPSPCDVVLWSNRVESDELNCDLEHDWPLSLNAKLKFRGLVSPSDQKCKI